MQLAKPGQSVRFLLHYPTDATIEKNRTVIDDAPTRLTCDTLLPENDIHRVRTTSAITSVSLHLLGNDNGCIRWIMDTL